MRYLPDSISNISLCSIYSSLVHPFCGGNRSISSPEPAFLLSMPRVLIFNCQPMRFEHERPEVRESRTFSSDLARVRVLGADQKESGLSGTDRPCDIYLIVFRILACVVFTVPLSTPSVVGTGQSRPQSPHFF